MDFKLIWTEKASDDLEAIVRYICRDDPETARRIGFGIYDRVQILIANPEAGSRLPEKNDPVWRKLIFKSWKIVYRINRQDQTIEIARIWHAAQGEVEL